MAPSDNSLSGHKIVDEFLKSPLQVFSMGAAIEIGLIRLYLDADSYSLDGLSERLDIDGKGLRDLVEILSAYDMFAIRNGKSIATSRCKEVLKFYDLLKWKVWYMHHIYADMMNAKGLILSDFDIRESKIIDLWDYSKEPSSLEWVTFMRTLTKYDAPYLIDAVDFSQYKDILEIGGNAGELALQIAREYPDSRITIVDMDTVCKVGERYISSFPQKNQITFQGKDMFNDELDGKKDIVILKSVLHDHSESKVRVLLKRSYDCLKKGGKILIYELEKINLTDRTAIEDNLMYITFWGCFKVPGYYQGLLEEIGFQDFRTQKIEENGFFILTARR